MKSPHTILTYECIYEEQEKVEERLLSISRLNKEGKVLQREQYDTEGKLIKKEEYEYEGELVILSREEDLIENRNSKTICTYREDKLVNQQEYFNEKLTIEMVYTYNDQGQLIEQEILNNDGSYNSKYTYEYVDRKTTENFFDEEMTLVRKTETVTNDEDEIIEKKTTEIYEDREVVVTQKVEHKVEEGESIKNYFRNGAEVYEVIECPDEEGRIFQTISYDVAKDEESVVTREFDTRGLVLKEEITLNEEVIGINNVEFDEFENRVKVTRYSKLAEDHYDTTTYKFVNEYDDE